MSPPITLNTKLTKEQRREFVEAARDLGSHSTGQFLITPWRAVVAEGHEHSLTKFKRLLKSVGINVELLLNRGHLRNDLRKLWDAHYKKYIEVMKKVVGPHLPGDYFEGWMSYLFYQNSPASKNSSRGGEGGYSLMKNKVTFLDLNYVPPSLLSDPTVRNLLREARLGNGDYMLTPNQAERFLMKLENIVDPSDSQRRVIGRLRKYLAANPAFSLRLRVLKRLDSGGVRGEISMNKYGVNASVIAGFAIPVTDNSTAQITGNLKFVYPLGSSTPYLLYSANASLNYTYNGLTLSSYFGTNFTPESYNYVVGGQVFTTLNLLGKKITFNAGASIVLNSPPTGDLFNTPGNLSYNLNIGSLLNISKRVQLGANSGVYYLPGSDEVGGIFSIFSKVYW